MKIGNSALHFLHEHYPFLIPFYKRIEYIFTNISSKLSTSMLTKPYWYKVLKHFERHRYFRNGLTIPFLIGSRKIIEPNMSIQSIDLFLNDLRSSPYRTTLMKCCDIGEYIVGLLDHETKSIISNYKPVVDCGSIVITDESFKNVPNFDGVVYQLGNLYEDKIREGRYSKVKGSWNAYDEVDLSRLQKIAV